MGFIQNTYTTVTVLNLVLAVVIIFLERRNAGNTWAWLMVLLFLPAVGFILYVIFGQNLSRRKLYKLKEKEQEAAYAILGHQRSLFVRREYPFNAPEAAEYQDMIMMNLVSGMAVYTQDNDVNIYTDGHAKFDTMLRDIEGARHHIHLMYYIIHDDGIGRRLRDALVRKAKEGVEVRVLYDDIGSYKLPDRFFEPLKAAGGFAAAFFPSKIPYFNIRVNYRNHRKLVIVDGRIGYLGGFNVGDEYLGIDKRFGHWRDTHLRLRGSAVFQIQVQFLLDWNLASSERLSSHMAYFPLEEAVGMPRGRVGVQIVSSGPNEQMQQIKNAYIKLIHKAKKSVWIQTPYFIPDESFLDALKMAAMSGVDVRIMIPRTPDHKMVYWATYSYLGDLLPLGVRCFLYGNGFLHAKTIVVDGMAASVGTANFDMRSFKLNFETNAFLYSRQVGERLQAYFEKDLEDSTELTLADYEGRSTRQKIRESFTRLLSPIL